MRFIHGQSHQPPFPRMDREHVPRRLPLETLRGEVKKTQAASRQLRLNQTSLFGLNPAVQAGGSNAPPLELQNLIIHQGNEWRNHHHQPLPDQGRELKTE
jgi:hypothetical protein